MDSEDRAILDVFSHLCRQRKASHRAECAPWEGRVGNNVFVERSIKKRERF